MITRLSIDEFNRCLKKENPDTSIVLIPDRASSDAIIERLSNDRIKNGWPHPGVFRLKEFSQAVIKESDRSFALNRFQEILIPSPAEQFHLWYQIQQSKKGEISPAASYQDFQQIASFHKVDATFEQWKEIVLELEKGSRTELKPVTERILHYLEWAATLQKENKVTSYWAFLKECGDILSSLNNSESSAFLRRATQRRAHESGQIHIYLVAHVELFPLERRLLEALNFLANNSLEKVHLKIFEFPSSSQHLNRGEQLKSLEDQVEILSKSLPEFESRKLNGAKDLAIVTLSELNQSYLVEVAESLGQWTDLHIDTPENTQWELSFKLFKSWIDYQQKNCPTHHPIVRDQKLFDAFKERENFPNIDTLKPYSNEEVHETLATFLRSKNPFDEILEKVYLKNLQAAAPSHRLEWLDIFLALGYFDFLKATPSLNTFESLFSPTGIFLGEWTHALLLGQPMAFRGDRKQFKKAFQPFESENIKRHVFLSKDLDLLLEAQGIQTPDFAKEQIQFVEFIQSRPKLFSLITDSEILPTIEVPRAMFFQTEKLTLSPSALQTYLQCPAKFYYQNLLRADTSPTWDPENIDPSLKGQWLHKVLENIFQEKHLFLKPLPECERLIAECLIKWVDPFFEKNTSASYRKIIAKIIPEWAQLLAQFFIEHERACERFAPHRKLYFEEKFQSSYLGRKIRFVVDRLDVLPDGNYLLWDYKTGAAPTGKLDTLLKKGQLQLPLYVELIKALAPSDLEKLGLQSTSRCLGFAYLSPLKPEKSLYFYSDSTEELFKHWNTSEASKAYPFKEDEISSQLNSLLGEPMKALFSGTFSPTPRQSSLCHSCPQSAICGKPYLEINSQNFESGEDSYA